MIHTIIATFHILAPNKKEYGVAILLNLTCTLELRNTHTVLVKSS